MEFNIRRGKIFKTKEVRSHVDVIDHNLMAPLINSLLEP